MTRSSYILSAHAMAPVTATWPDFTHRMAGFCTAVDTNWADSIVDVAGAKLQVLRRLLAQAYLTTLISGIVNRILRDALDLIRARGRNYYHALHERPAQEPELQAVVGRIAAHRAAIQAVTERAAAALDLAWAKAEGPRAAELSVAASIAAAEAKVVTDETAATLAGLLLDVSSGSGVSTTRALDRHWRNIKVIAAHNPRVYKERVLGDHYLNGTPPPTGAFF